MSDLILHHYEMSPFSAKTRAMLGHAGLDWQSVITREMPPRPLLATLAGGYRKIPVAQIGADIFCDTRTIAAEIAALAGLPLLDPAQCSEEARTFARVTDLQVFMDCLVAAGTLTMARKMLQAMSLRDVARFFADRIQIGRKARVRAGDPRRARERVRAHLADLSARLQGQDFLFGDQPCHADFSAWHSLWFVRDMGESLLVADFASVMAWMDRMRAFGEGRRSEITAEQALAAARMTRPREVPAEWRADALIGQRVQVAPADYGRDPTVGVLAGMSATRWILAREVDGLGLLHVHFPREGFVLKPV